MALGSLVMRLVTTYHTEQDRPTRWVIPQGENKTCQDKVYHPEELPKVQLLMNEFFQGFNHNKIDNHSQSMSAWSSSVMLSYCMRTFYPDVADWESMLSRFAYRSESISFSSNWVLVSAFLDTQERILHYPTAYNVTHILRMLIKHGSHLSFSRADPLDKRERLILSRASHIRYRWWYTRLLGDVGPRLTKTLVIYARDQDSDIVRPFFIVEDTKISFPLKAGEEDTSPATE